MCAQSLPGRGQRATCNQSEMSQVVRDILLTIDASMLRQLQQCLLASLVLLEASHAVAGGRSLHIPTLASSRRNRKTGYRCPRGSGKHSRFPDQCPGKVRLSLWVL